MIKQLRMCMVLAVASLAMACAPMLAVGGVSSAVGAVSDLISSVSPTVKVVSGKVTIEGTRGLILAHNAVQAASNGLAPFVRAKRFDAATVNRIEALADRAEQLLAGGRAGLTVAERTAGLFAIADEFNRLQGK